MTGMLKGFSQRIEGAIPKEFGRGTLRPSLKIAATGLLIMVISLSISYPFPLGPSDIPKKSTKAFSAVVIMSHKDGIVEGFMATDSGRDPFIIKDTRAQGAVLKQLRKFDLANSRVFKFVYWFLVFAWILANRGAVWVSSRFPDLPEFGGSEPQSSMEEYKGYMRRYMELHGKREDPLRKAPGAPRGDKWYRKPYWNEVVMAFVIIVTFCVSLGFWSYLNPDFEKDVNIKTAGKGIGAMDIKSYPEPERRH